MFGAQPNTARSPAAKDVVEEALRGLGTLDTDMVASLREGRAVLVDVRKLGKQAVRVVGATDCTPTRGMCFTGCSM